MKAMSTPPWARGPPSAVHRRPFLRIQASKADLASLVNLRSGSATPWRILWLFFVVLKTAGLGFGTYLAIAVRDRPGGGGKCGAYQAASTSRADKNLIRACRIYRVANHESIVEIKLCIKKKKLTKATPPIEPITSNGSTDNVRD